MYTTPSMSTHSDFPVIEYRCLIHLMWLVMNTHMDQSSNCRARSCSTVTAATILDAMIFGSIFQRVHCAITMYVQLTFRDHHVDIMIFLAALAYAPFCVGDLKPGGVVRVIDRRKHSDPEDHDDHWGSKAASQPRRG